MIAYELETNGSYTASAADTYSSTDDLGGRDFAIAGAVGALVGVLAVDWDKDGYNTAQDIATGNNPFSADTDGDGLIDTLDYARGVPDADNDGLADSKELNMYRTSTVTWDSDADGISDRVEVMDLGTDPNWFDTDGDGYTDMDELGFGSDPLVPDSHPSYEQSDVDIRIRIPGFDFRIR